MVARLLRVALTVVLLAMGSACGEAPRTESPTASSSAPPPPEEVACDRWLVMSSALTGPFVADEHEPAAAAARRELPSVQPGLVTAPLRELARTDTEVLFGLGTPGFGYRGAGQMQSYIAVRKEGDGYTFANSGACVLRPPVPRGRSFADWAVAPASKPLRPDMTEVDLLISERECTGGQSALDRLEEPTITYGKNSVTVALVVRSPVGGGVYPCIGISPEPYRLKLREPLGKRELLDGGVYPAMSPPDTIR